MSNNKAGIPAKNVGAFERCVSVVSGAALVLQGIVKGGAIGFLKAVLGGGMLYRGVTGTCAVYKALGVCTAEGAAKHLEGIKIERTIRINRPIEDVFAYWKNIENFPHIMSHLTSVARIGNNVSRWTVATPGGQTIYWDAKIINCIDNEIIAWRSLKGAQLPNVGSVHFTEEQPGETTVRLSIQFYPPDSKIGASAAHLFGDRPDQRLVEDLNRFKAKMEAREIAFQH